MKRFLGFIVCLFLVQGVFANAHPYIRSQVQVFEHNAEGYIQVIAYYKGNGNYDDQMDWLNFTLTYNGQTINLLHDSWPHHRQDHYRNSTYSINGTIFFNPYGNYVERVYQSVNNQNWFDQNDSYGVVSSSNHPKRLEPSSNHTEYEVVVYTFRDLPAEIFETNYVVNVTGFWNQENDRVEDGYNINDTYSMSNPVSVGKPTGLNQMSEYCDKVVLNWTKGNNTNINSSNSNTTYDIYRNDVLIASHVTGTTYSDNTAFSNSYFDYKVVQNVTYTNHSIRNSRTTEHNTISGIISDTYTAATTKNQSPINSIEFETNFPNSCTGEIEVNWTNQNQPNNFVIDRMIDPNCTTDEVKTFSTSFLINTHQELLNFLPASTFSLDVGYNCPLGNCTARGVYPFSGSNGWNYPIKIHSYTYKKHCVDGTYSQAQSPFGDNDSQIGNVYYYTVKSQLNCPTPSNANGQQTVDSDWLIKGPVTPNDVPSKPTLESVTLDPNSNEIQIEFKNTSEFTDDIEIKRVGGGTTELFPVTPDTTLHSPQVYLDNSTKICELYSYSVIAKNECSTNGVESDSTIDGYKPSTDLVQSFAATSNGVQSSDGEFGDRVEIKWNPKGREAENWYINRINPAIPDTTLIAVVDGKSRFYTDRTANANTIYQYEIYGDADCAGNVVNSDIATDNGFRLAFGTVNGQITYQGGTASENVKVVANAASGLSGMSGFFNGSSSINAGNFDDANSDTMTFMAWINPTSLVDNDVIAEKGNGATGWKLFISNNKLALNTYTNTGNTYRPAIDASDLLNKWTCIAFTIGQNLANFYKDGVLIGSYPIPNNSRPNDSISDFKIGRDFNGNIDEVKYYNRALSEEEIKHSTDVFVNPSQNGLRGYWRFDEGFGNIVYDYSKTLQTANRNHAQMHGVTFNNSKPSSSSLTAGAYTDKNGSYFIPFIPYLGIGDNFTITPVFGSHVFSPVNIALFIGGTSPNFTSKDFTDESSFEFSGTVTYSNTGGNQGGQAGKPFCNVEDVLIKIDGEPVVKNGQTAKTNAQGQFSIQVPIGDHVITLEKNGHVFEKGGRFPEDPSLIHNFANNISGHKFKDSTLLTIKGRVAGGLVEKAKLYNKGKNNIGIATIEFSAQQGGGCLIKDVTTDPNSGIYTIMVPPLSYTIKDFHPTFNDDDEYKFENIPLLDLSLAPPLTTDYDTTVTLNASGSTTSIDTVEYHKSLDFIVSVTPSIFMVNADSTSLSGDATVNIGGTPTTVSTLNLPYSIFSENIKYKTKIYAGQRFVNKDAGQNAPTSWVYDQIPIKRGKIILRNNLAQIKDTVFNITPLDTFPGFLEYTFTGGQANNATNTDSSLSFTNTLELSLEAPNTNTAYWKPNSLTTDKNYRGIVFGAKALGSSFFTEGPQVVTMILRDPPGTNSFSSWLQNTEITTSTSIEVTGGTSTNLDRKVSAGTEFTSGVGLATPTKIEASVNNSTRLSTSIGADGGIVETVSNSVDISTGDNIEFVGSDADLFYGKSFNMDFGKAEKIKFILASECAQSSNRCSGALYTIGGTNFKLGAQTSVFTIPKTYGTEFVYTQRGIEGILIPKLQEQIENLLRKDPSNPIGFNTHGYKSIINPGATGYGKTNDAGTTNANINTHDDDKGLSYEFNRANLVLSNPDIIDSVWWFNQQIRLWEDALRRNEKEKVTANSGNLTRNISYQAGGPITYTNSRARDSSITTTISINIGTTLATAIGAEVGGTGAGVETGLNLDVTTNAVIGFSTGSTTTFSYTISDTDDDDEFSVDVFDDKKNGHGPIFKTRGGQTSCPYQGQELTKYYAPGTEINKATLKLDDPVLTIPNSSLSGIPADQVAVFNVELYNNSTEATIYNFRVLDSSNRYGAVIKMDGINPNRAIPIPEKTTIYKQLTVARGSVEIEYKDIELSLQSSCQYAGGTAGFEDIESTQKISVDFVPDCGDLNIENPGDQFVLNNLTKPSNSLTVKVGNFDQNYFGLKGIKMEYKSASSQTWTTLDTAFAIDQTNAISDLNNLISINPAKIGTIPATANKVTFEFDMSQLPDGIYQLRAASVCQIPKVNGATIKYSPVITGIKDTLNPVVFGTPTPGDGVLDPNDDISIQFNETIDPTSFVPSKISLTGVKNGQPIRHDKSLAFNGTNQALEIAEGFNFTEKDFTVEFWLKPSARDKEQTIISQGIDASNEFYIGFNASNKMEVVLGNSSQKHTSTLGIEQANLNKWIHFSVAYDSRSFSLEIIKTLTTGNSKDNHTLNSEHNVGGKTFIGRHADTSIANYFDGALHNFRIWNKALSEATLASRITILLTGREPGLLAYWPMNEGFGLVVNEIARGRNLNLQSEHWELNPLSFNLELPTAANKTYLTADTAGALVVTEEMDMTIEFWFKTSGGQLMSFLSNGSGLLAAGDVNRNGWNIEMAADNKIHIKNDSTDFIAVSNDFADDNWHHFAFVLNRRGNSTAYIDGKQQETTPSGNFYGFGAQKLAIGARLTIVGTQETIDQEYAGRIDEIRVWNTARKVDAINANMNHALHGNEVGLKAYYPFENYDLANLVNIEDLDNKAVGNNQLILTNGSTTTSSDFVNNTSSPLVSLPPPVQNIKFTQSLNNDKVIITPTEDPSVIENVTMFVTVQDMVDLRGNILQSPESWLAFVNKNQTVWQKPKENKIKELNDTMTFTNVIVNQGGGSINYNLHNIPDWLFASSTAGTLAPLSQEIITFTIDPNAAIGNYSEDVHLLTDHGFDEKFQVNLKVRKAAPQFAVNPANFQHSMSFIGQLSINYRISSNQEDLLIAVDDNDQVRGVAQLQYEELFDRYMIYLDVYSNAPGDSISFKIWNSRSGELHADAEMIEPVFGKKIAFATNSVIGTPSIPQLFNAIDYIEKPIALTQGWNWVSFPLLNEHQANFSKFFVKEIGKNIIEVKSESAFRKPNSNGTWRNGGLKKIENEKSYLINMKQADTLDYYGFALGADTMPIQVAAGWNRIGYISLSNMPLQMALANYNAKEGDVIKSQENFAYYDSTLGWVGSLTAMKSTEGYLMKVREASSFTYPLSAQLRLKESESNESINMEQILANKYQFDNGGFESTSSAILHLNCEYINENEHLLLAAYHGEDIRGLARLESFKEENRAYLTVYGETNETFNYVLIDTLKNKQYKLEGSLQFAKNKLEGTPNNPIQLSLLLAEDCEAFKPISQLTKSFISPNPFADRLVINLTESIAEQAQIELVDAKGRVLSRFNANGRMIIEMENEYPTLENLPSGTYFIKISGRDEVIIEKAIKL